MDETSPRQKSSEDRWALPASQARSRATRARLLAAAEEVFAQKGYDGAKMADIARVASVSVGAAYFRFPDKSALFSAIAEGFVADARAVLAPLLSATSRDPRATVEVFVTAAAASFRKHRGLFRAIVERGLENPAAMTGIFRFREELAAALGNALELPKTGPARLKVQVMTQMVYGFLLTGVFNPRAPTRLSDARTLAGLTEACVGYLNL